MTLDYESSLEGGFQIATLQGPMCAEPVQGMTFVLESLSDNKNEGEQQETDSKSHQK
jgi:ribosome assembly protein 1